MTTFHWVRHGPTHEKTFVGWRDVPADLTDSAQIARLNAHLPERAVLLSSDLIRCVATADAVAHPERRRLPHERDLRELDFGEWDGKHWKEVAESHPALSRAYWETPGDIAAPGGESWNGARARVDAAVDRLMAAHSGQHIVAVAHFGVILMQVQRALGVSATDAMAHKIDNLSVTSMTCEDGAWQVHHINHLP